MFQFMQGRTRIPYSVRIQFGAHRGQTILLDSIWICCLVPHVLATPRIMKKEPETADLLDIVSSRHLAAWRSSLLGAAVATASPMSSLIRTLQ